MQKSVFFTLRLSYNHFVIRCVLVNTHLLSTRELTHANYNMFIVTPLDVISKEIILIIAFYESMFNMYNITGGNTGLGSSVGSVSTSYASGPPIDPRVWHILSRKNNFPVSLIQ